MSKIPFLGLPFFELCSGDEEVMYDLDEGLEKINEMVNNMVAEFFNTVRRFMVRRATNKSGDNAITTDLVFVMRNAVGSRSFTPASEKKFSSQRSVETKTSKSPPLRQIVSEFF